MTESIIPRSNSSHIEAELRLLAPSPHGEKAEGDNQNKKLFHGPPWIANRPAWTVTVAAGFALTAAALLVNASLLGWIYSSFGPVDDGTVVLFSGSCSKASLFTTVAHLAINILSTLLLAVSNNCAQLLSSPTRAEADKAHKSGQWLHIGTFSYRNFLWIGKWRIVVCGFLILSSIPLHLIYNSVIFSSTYANDFLAAAVTDDFLDNGYWDTSNAQQTYKYWGSNSISGTKNYTGQVQKMQQNISNLTRLDTSTCESMHKSLPISSPYRNILLVTSVKQNDTWLSGMLGFPETYIAENSFPAWMYGEALFGPSQCSPASWAGVNKSLPLIIANYTKGSDGFDCQAYTAPVEFCLAESAAEFSLNCTVSANTTLLILVIACNVVKLVCLAVNITAWKFQPLAVIGDAIASFMERPDPTTDGLGPLSCRMVILFPSQKLSFQQKLKALGTRGRKWNGSYDIRWRDKPYRWKHAISSPFNLLVITLCIIAWFCVLVILFSHQVWSSSSLKAGFDNEVSQDSNEFSKRIGSTKASSVISNALAVNAIQLLVSIVYVTYNSLLTRMLAFNEYSHLAEHKRTLRVSSPVGEQRSTFFLQIPYRYSIPLLTSMGLLHWLISRGVYLVNVRVYDVSGTEVPDRARYSRGMNPLPLLIAFLLGTAIWFALFIIMWKRLGRGMPIIGTCSAAISAACHPLTSYDGDATKALTYGVLSEELHELREHDVEPAEAGEGNGTRIVSFSRGAVQPLVAGYYQKGRPVTGSMGECAS